MSFLLSQESFQQSVCMVVYELFTAAQKCEANDHVSTGIEPSFKPSFKAWLAENAGAASVDLVCSQVLEAARRPAATGRFALPTEQVPPECSSFWNAEAYTSLEEGSPIAGKSRNEPDRIS
jgi:hypothetical protein